MPILKPRPLAFLFYDFKKVEIVTLELDEVYANSIRKNSHFAQEEYSYQVSRIRFPNRIHFPLTRQKACVPTAMDWVMYTRSMKIKFFPIKNYP